jgi:anhydro-N-acetylmuramic acid kinase
VSAAAVAQDARLYLGLISGTSADAIDAALVAFDPAPRVVAARAFDYPAEVRERVLAMSRGSAETTLEALGELDVRVGLAFADAANALIAGCGVARDAIAAIGSHGQTVRHRPRNTPAFTMQIGDPTTIVERTGILTVADFRRRDVAAGGEGAPLAPAFHAAVLRAAGEARAVLNLGGIANLTLLPADPAAPVRGFDTGPANCLLDAWSARHLGCARDEGGTLARQGRIDEALLARLLDEPYFALPPPKSTGREEFDLDWLAARAPLPTAPADLLATLAELSARTIADALRASAPATRRVVACGGGVHNGLLMERIRAALGGIPLETSREHGIDPDFVEAALFAWLARECLAGRPGNLPAVSGARGPRVLGAIHPP